MTAKEHSFAQLRVAGDITKVVNRAAVSNASIMTDTRSHVENHEIANGRVDRHRHPRTENRSHSDVTSRADDSRRVNQRNGQEFTAQNLRVSRET